MIVKVTKVLKGKYFYYPVDEFSKNLLRVVNPRAESFSAKALHQLEDMGFEIECEDKKDG